MQDRTPYRIVVFAKGVTKGKRIRQYAYQAWTEDQTAEPHRLQGSGTFLFNGLHVVRNEAIRILLLPATESVSIRTNQDRSVYRYCKDSHGRVSGYVPD